MINTRYPQKFEQSAVYVAGDKDQFDTVRARKSLTHHPIDLSANMFADRLNLIAWDQIGWPKYEHVTSRAVTDTFNYIFYKFKKGIFIAINDRIIESFLPFSNVNYRNEFATMIRVKQGDTQQFLDRISALEGRVNKGAPYRAARAIPLNQWQANNAMFRYEHQPTEPDTNIVTIKDMFDTLLSTRDVPDVAIYVNRRDNPLLTLDGYEPYNHLYGSRKYKLVSHNYDKYVPILSGSTASGFADLAIPTYEDWARATYQSTGRTFPQSNTKYPKIYGNQRDWASKRSIAVFRGSSTGAGTTDDTNQRLRALKLAEDHRDLLDVGITKWNLRPRKHESSRFLTTIERRTYPLANRMTLQEQTNEFKYILTLEGHVAAYRLSYELSSGSVVLLASSRWRMWYSSLIKPFIHYVPVKEDLSDLIDKIHWCRSHDTECIEIVKRANEFYEKYLGIDGQMDYLQLLLMNISLEQGAFKYISNPLDTILAIEQEWVSSTPKTIGSFKHPLPSGNRCIGRLDAMMHVFQCDNKKLDVIKPATFSSKHCVVDMVRLNGFTMAKKTAKTDEKRKEHKHETYIGIKCVNDLVAKCPNYAYTFGADDTGAIYSEYVDGPTLADWLKSSQYNLTDFLNILMQLNMAITVGQRYCAFIHYDLYPWNIIIQTIREPIHIDYCVDNGWQYRYTTNIVPIIIDYGKSRAVSFDEKYGLIDHGFVNLFNNWSRLVDILTLLFSSMALLIEHKKLSTTEVNTLLEYPRRIGLHDNVTDMTKYGAVFESLNNITPPASLDSPLAFNQFLIDSFGVGTNIVNIVVPELGPSQFKMLMSRGVRQYFIEMMTHGNKQKALYAIVSKINKQTRPQSDNAVIALLIDSNLARRVRDFDELFAPIDDNKLRIAYDKVRSFVIPQHTDKRYVTDTISVDFPIIDYSVIMDSDIDPESLIDYAAHATKFNDDWITIWSTCSEAAMFDQRLDIFDTSDINPFVFFNNIASHNTCLMLRANVDE